MSHRKVEATPTRLLRAEPTSDDSPFDEKSQIYSADPAAARQGIVAFGGHLAPGVLLSAYGQGIFPWSTPGDPILWWSPDPRCVIDPSHFHVSRSLQRLLIKKRFTFSTDKAFESTINACSVIERPGQDGTWIDDAMIDAYVRLHYMGHAHSVEVWDGPDLVGGLYGVATGSMFSGESMFSLVSNASKSALALLAAALAAQGVRWIDCQVETDHLKSLGAQLLPRSQFLSELRRARPEPGLTNFWGRGDEVAEWLAGPD